MTKYLKAAAFLLAFSGLSISSWAQLRDYPSYQQLTNRLLRLGKLYPTMCSINTVGKTATGKEVWLITLGRDNAIHKPAMVIAAGVDATQLATVELSVQMAEQMLEATKTDDSVLHLLRTKTIYIFPNLNPDATEQYTENLRWERSGNAQPTDDDRDGRTFEDPHEDLNNDGMISLIRVQDSTGLYRTSAIDPRILVKIRPDKGEKGSYSVWTEGVDNDQDGQLNEDPEGGVAFNKNFPFAYPAFQRGAGEHALSERETKAFADFLFNAHNVYAVFVLGPANTLTEPLKFDKPKGKEQIIPGLLEKDAAVNKEVSTLYNAHLSAAGAPKGSVSGGDVLQWAYFHYGRFSYGTPGWWIPPIDPPKDSLDIFQTLSDEEKEVLNYVRWAKDNDIIGSFVNWTPIEHPDFPGKVVEVGGFAPYVRHTPPVRLLAPVAQKHNRFFREFAAHMPQLEIVNLTTEILSGGLTRISAEILNKGSLPTHASIGDRTRWVQKVKISLRLTESQEMVTGNRVYLHEAIAGGQKIKVTWVLKGKGYVGIEASSPTAGSQKKEIVLR